VNKTIEIRHRWTNSCLWTGEIEASGTDRIDLGRAVLAARKAGAYLQGADLLYPPDADDEEESGAQLRCHIHKNTTTTEQK